MTQEELFALLDRFERSSCTGLKLSQADVSLELAKGSIPGTAAQPVFQQAAPAPAEEPVVTAPLVGTYYAAPAPDQPPFIKVGDRVSKGQTVCLLEAMKMMSEIPAPCELIVEELLRKDGELVSFGDPILRYRAV